MRVMEIYNGTYCVYMHTNKINGKFYIGQTCQKPEKRWNDGKGYLVKKPNGEYSQSLIARAIIKYGWDNFEHEVIASNLTLEEANHFEELLINKLDATNPNKGYNLQSGGENRKQSELSRKKMSEKRKQRVTKNETRLKVSLFFSSDKNPNLKPIIQYDLFGNKIKEWKSIISASEYTNISRSQISSCAKHKYGYKTAGGFIWRYLDDPLTKEEVEIILKSKLKS